jgi:hypothetical protein
MDIIYFTFISHPTRKQYNLQEEEEEEEIEAWFCLFSQPNVEISPASFMFFFTTQTPQNDHQSVKLQSQDLKITCLWHTRPKARRDQGTCMEYQKGL